MKKIREVYSTYRKLVRENPDIILSEEQLNELSLDLSSGINNLRKTLDHAMWSIAKRNPDLDLTKKSNSLKVSFPIKYSASSFANWKIATQGFYPPEVIDFVESLQPYENRPLTIYRKAIYLIATVDNFSKHSDRLVVTQYNSVSNERRITVDDDGTLQEKLSTINNSMICFSIPTPNGEEFTLNLSPGISDMEIYSILEQILDRFINNNFSPLTDIIWKWDRKEDES